MLKKVTITIPSTSNSLSFGSANDRHKSFHEKWTSGGKKRGAMWRSGYGVSLAAPKHIHHGEIYGHVETTLRIPISSEGGSSILRIWLDLEMAKTGSTKAPPTQLSTLPSRIELARSCVAYSSPLDNGRNLRLSPVVDY